MKKNIVLLISSLFLWLGASNAYAWSVYIGQATSYQGGAEYADVQDYSAPFSWNLLPSVAAHTESGLRELAVSNATEFDPKHGLNCNYNHDVHSVNLYHGFQSAGIKNNSGNPLWKTNTTGLYLGMEITKINFGTAYYPGSSFWVDWNGGGTDYKSFDLNFISTSYADFSTFCDSIAWKKGYFEMGGIVLWIKFHLYADDTFKPTTSAVNVTFPTSTGYNFRFKLSDTSIGGGNHYLDYVISPGSITIHYPTCTATAVTGEGVSGSTVPFGSRNAEELKGDGVTKDFSIKLSNCTYIKNVEVKLGSTITGSSDNALLGNTLTSGAASGIGVTVAGEKNPASISDWMTIMPNNSSSVYKFTNMEDYTYSNIGNPDQILNFRATLKQDGSNTIKPGEFKATGSFTIDYP
ncbi:hypothetical protein BZK40_16900 [Citrobacter portucalensis]|uniref:fimbrial protein n=1 Tax=Citrobacter portucalensis TaxID=1639133 RepID=UPI0009ACAFDC|nr:fimbrial protein [Citrobacter portucalensis]OPW91063.1 hypothetical protein BZK40_16900 [Citrobacter portucalensis]